MMRLILLLIPLLLLSCDRQTESETEVAHLQSFQNPPDEARPRVWWHWMNGNITQEGIRKDLAWMKRTGIAGFQNFDANLFTPVVVENPLVFMTPEWKEAFKLTAELADSTGLEMTIAGSPGWSVTGGPWVEPEDGMKKYVWTETRIEGGQTFNGTLPQPKETTGAFQNTEPEAEIISTGEVDLPTYYNDALVVAYKVLPADLPLNELNPTARSSGGSFTVDQLTDGDLHATSHLPPREVGEEMWIQYEFDEPQTFKAISVAGANHIALEQFNGGPENRRLMVSDDGVQFDEIARIPGSIAPQNTVAFEPATAKIWRLAYETLPPPFNPLIAMFGGGGGDAEPEGVEVAEFVLHPTDRIDQFEDKVAVTPWREDTPTYRAGSADAISSSDVIDLTDLMQDDGTLNWDAPEGDWVVLRMGYSLTGRQNHPASPAGTGLEVDKLDGDAVRRYINTYLDMYQDATGGLMGESGLQYLILDSYEAGHMNWTHNFSEEFEERRGYEIESWVPVLTGRIVESREASEAFLWDFRKTIGEMIAENHYDVIGEELKKRGMGRYTESHENQRIFMADGMDVKRNADVPMSAMWTPGSLGGGADEEVRSEADIRESASVAHIYGKPYVAAESMTSIGNGFSFSPEKLKRTADLEMASGLNRFVIHTSVHQPLDNLMPGFSLGPFGQYFTRQETWAEQARPWIDYLSRSCYMLQQGRFVADALVFYGENTNLTWAFRDELPRIPGYEFDFINATALIEATTARGGKITTPGGGSYSVLVLDESAWEMTLPVLQRIKELADAGVAVAGVKPERSPALSDDQAAFDQLVEEIWSMENVSDQPAAEMLKARGVDKDVVISGNSAEILYVHRSMPGMEIYWLDNRSVDKNQAEISFRVSGKAPKLWHPETGDVEDISWEIRDGRTVVSLDFESWEAYFIVFEENTSEQSFQLEAIIEEPVQTIAGPWQVSFQAGRGAPVSAVFESLVSWTESPVPGIKYFSGTATYSNTFSLTESVDNSRILLDLGDVKNLAEVTLNGQNLGILWKMPFEVDITDALQAGVNELQIAVTNLWVNRLIGDAQPGVEDKTTFTTMPFYQADSPLLPSGLLSEVRLVRIGG